MTPDNSHEAGLGGRTFLWRVLLLIAVVVLASGLFFQPRPVRGQDTPLLLELITWNILGLDEDDLSNSPNTYVVAARICNLTNDPLPNLRVTFTWEDGDGDSAIQLVTSDNSTPSTVSVPLGTLPPEPCWILPIQVRVARDSASIDETRTFSLEVTADGVDADDRPSVEQKLLVVPFQQRDPASGVHAPAPDVSGPDVVEVGQTVAYTIHSGPISADYNQLVHQVFFDPSIFRIIGIHAVHETAPQNMNDDQFYADACGWNYDEDDDSFTCNDSSRVVGGSSSVTFTVQVVGTGETRLINQVYGYVDSAGTSGAGDFYYQDLDYVDGRFLDVTAIQGGSTVTPSPTITGTPPTPTPSLTPTITGTVTPDIEVDYSVSPTEARPGQNVTFTLDISNEGNADATSVRVTDTYSNFLDIRSISISPSNAGSYSISGRSFTANLNTLEAGEDVRITIVTTVNNSATSTTTESTSAVLTYTFNGTRTVTSNSVSVRILGGTTLPGTGFMEIQQPSGPPPFLVAFTLVAALLALSGAALLLLSRWARTKQPAWAGWYLRTGAILLMAGLLFGLGAWGLNRDVPGGGELADLIAGTPAAPSEEPRSLILPTDDAASLPIYWPTSTPEPETLPDYPIPTPSIQPTPGEDGQIVVDTSPVNRIVIPILGVDTVVKYVPFDGYTWLIAGLQQEVAWMGDTSWPGLGGNTSLAGHVTLRDGSDGPFRNLDQLQPGQEVIVYTENNIYTYRVRSSQEVDVSDVSPIQQSNEPLLTLITCTQWDQEERMYQKRLVVTGELVEVRPFFNETASRLP